MKNITLEKIARRAAEVAARRYRATRPVGPLQVTQVSERDARQSATFALREGDRWGVIDGVYQIAFTLTIPPEWRGQMLGLRVMLAGERPGWLQAESLLFVDGQPLHAFDQYHHEIVLPPELAARERLDCQLCTWTGYSPRERVVHALQLGWIDPATDRLAQKMGVVLDLARHLPAQSLAATNLIAALEDVCQTLDFRDPDAFYRASAEALARLEARYQAISVTADEVPPGTWPQLTAIGHAHIDVAWLWRLHHTRMKAANTFATALFHMERYPHFVFLQSTPQLYQFVKEDHPEIYARIQARVAAGQWEAEGATWLEMDTNITGGESLVRQFIHGQRFFREEFGHTSRILWLPDVFGYSAALPQIIKKGGADYFATIKISWNETNRFPYDTFTWEGIDGTRVLTHYVTTPTDGEPVDGPLVTYNYNATMTPREALNTWRAYQQKGLTTELLTSYGYGDGGGGPTREMIETATMLGRSVSSDVPIVQMGQVLPFFDRLAQRLQGRADVPTWVGELYLEYHRGTYTSQAMIKRANRMAEQDLHTAEWLAAFAQRLVGADYPRAELDRAWKAVLLHQFHDILPGSSIAEVYQDAPAYYTQVAAVTTRARDDALRALTAQIAAPEGSLIVFNPTAFPRTDLVILPGERAAALGLSTQPLDQGLALALAADVPALGYRAYAPAASRTDAAPTPFTITPTLLESVFYRIELNDRGQITRWLDKAGDDGRGREVLAAGERGNVLQLFEDKPLTFDAWDINAYYEEKQWEVDRLVDAAVEEAGPLRATLRLRWTTGQRTTITQRIRLYQHTRRVDFVTEVDWYERQTLLKVTFPVAVRNTQATAEIQFGNIQRPTHRNTSWDRARFETCAHRWFDLSEGDYGVAILNDSKYGYDVHDHVMRQTLLKGAIEPDPRADEGHHQFTYSVLPHARDWFAGGVPAAAYALNYPLLAESRPTVAATALPRPGLPPALALVTTDAPHVIVETVKQAEASADLVVRVYECANRRGPFTLTLPFAIQAAAETNLLEEQPMPVTLSADGKTLSSAITPYEIKTFVITPR